MKVLLLNGSPHKNGSTFLALSEAAKTLNEEGIETEIFQIGAGIIAPCKACGACAMAGKCAIDDKVNDFTEMAENFDGFIFGSPVHYAAISSTIKSFLDRAFFSTSKSNRSHVFKHKPGASVVVARRAGSTSAIEQLNKYFSISEMPIISGRYWNMAFGANQDEVKYDLEGMQNLRILARNFSWYLKCMDAAKKANVPMPEKEEIVYTNFIR